MTSQCKKIIHYVTPAFSAYYFSIIEEETGKALDATSEGDVILYQWKPDDNDNQLWFWKDVGKTILENKKYNTKLVFNFQFSGTVVKY